MRSRGPRDLPAPDHGTCDLVIGVDVGGTKVLGAEVDRAGRPSRVVQAPTPARGDPVERLEDALTSVVAEVAEGREVAAVGVSAAALVDAGRVEFATHLSWRRRPVAAILEQRWRVPVVLENDANCALVAELAYGAARGESDVVMVTVGTGIGGAVSLGGRLVRGQQGMAGEFGHQQVVPGGRSCECGRRGCWEQYASGKALVRLVADSRPELREGTEVMRAALAGDATAQAAFATVGEWLGVGVASLVAVLDPALVVVGGGVCAAGDLLLHPARAGLARSVYATEHRVVPPVLVARLGPTAGAIGAARLARTILG